MRRNHMTFEHLLFLFLFSIFCKDLLTSFCFRDLHQIKNVCEWSLKTVLDVCSKMPHIYFFYDIQKNTYIY